MQHPQSDLLGRLQYPALPLFLLPSQPATWQCNIEYAVVFSLSRKKLLYAEAENKENGVHGCDRFCGRPFAKNYYSIQSRNTQLIPLYRAYVSEFFGVNVELGTCKRLLTDTRPWMVKDRASERLSGDALL